MRKALWPKVEYNSSPGVTVKRLICKWHESCCANVLAINKKKTAKNNEVVLKIRSLVFVLKDSK